MYWYVPYPVQYTTVIFRIQYSTLQLSSLSSTINYWYVPYPVQYTTVIFRIQYSTLQLSSLSSTIHYWYVPYPVQYTTVIFLTQYSTLQLSSLSCIDGGTHRHPDWSIKARGKAPVWPLHYTIVGRIKSGSAVRQYALEGDFNRSFPVCTCCRIYLILLMHAPSCRNIELLWKH